MRRSKRAIVWFAEVGKEDLAVAGGKGANLGEMTRAQIPVPPGFIVSADAYFRFLDQADLRPRIQELVSPLNYEDSARLQKVSQEIKALISGAPVPDDIAQDIRAAYQEMGKGPVAVRSSATAEDLSDASFAGQQSTFLNVIGEDEVVDAVRACWASLFEARAIFCRNDKGFDHLEVAIAVPVQRMVQSSRSGVMFTVETDTGDHSKIEIEAVYGLGEAIVSGETTPDNYRIDKASLDILQTRAVTVLAEAGAKAAEAVETAPVLLDGTPTAPGVHAGPVRIALNASEIDSVSKGNVLEAEMTTPDFVPAMKRAAAIVTDRGGRTAHTADAGRYSAAAASVLVEKRAIGDFDVFLCHNSEDKPAVKEIGEHLKRLGILPWLDEWEVRPFKRWQDELQEIIPKIKAAAVFIGSSGVGPWQDIEANALLEQFARRKIPMGPVLLPDCPEEPELPLFLSGFRWVDFRKQDPDPMEQLVWGITGKRTPAGRIAEKTKR